MADATRSLTDLFGMFGTRRVADAGPAADTSVTNVAEASYPTKALQKFLASLQPAKVRCCSTSVPSSAATSRFSASSWVAGCASRTSPRTSIGTSRTARSSSSRSSSRSGSRRSPAPLTASCAGTFSTISIGPPRRRSRRRSRRCFVPTAACSASSARRIRREARLHEIRRRG